MAKRRPQCRSLSKVESTTSEHMLNRHIFSFSKTALPTKLSLFSFVFPIKAWQNWSISSFGAVVTPPPEGHMDNSGRVIAMYHFLHGHSIYVRSTINSRRLPLRMLFWKTSFIHKRGRVLPTTNTYKTLRLEQ